MGSNNVACSIVMPMRNTEQYVGQAVRSILEQSLADWELMVVDDGSTDGSRAIVESFRDPRIRLLDGPRQGISAAFNEGLQATSGRWIFWCDSDDLFPSDRLSWQAEWLEAHPEFGAICASFETIDPANRLVSTLGCGAAAVEITGELKDGVSRTSLNTFAVRREHYVRLGGLRRYFVTSEDLDFQFRLGDLCRVWYEPKLSYRYRLHNTSTTHTQPSPARLFYEETSRRFARQRKERGSDDLADGRPPAPPETAAPPLDSKEQIHGMLLGEAVRLQAKGERWSAIRLAARACLVKPTRAAGWRSLLSHLFR